jgi:hypothetical protein
MNKMYVHIASALEGHYNRIFNFIYHSIGEFATPMKHSIPS